MKTVILLCLMNILIGHTNAQQEMELYLSKSIPGAIPSDVAEKSETGTDGVLRVSQVTTPTLTYFAPSHKKPGGAAIIICPGGGYGILAMGHEGYDVAKTFASWGIHAFVLKYRLPNPALQSNPSFAPLQDSQEAIRLVRSKAADWQIAENKIGIMGFSAGGHLAASASTHFNTPVLQSNISCQPNASILIYPVISFTDSLTHKGSRQNLLGKTFTAELVISFSNELRVQVNTSPAFLVHSGDDGAVPVGNSLAYYQALQRNRISAELHVYPKGGHGYGMNNKTTSDKWTERLANWMKGLGWMK
jgi:acetyl esterase/lipase